MPLGTKYHGPADAPAETMHRAGADAMQAVTKLMGHLAPWLSCVEAE